MPSTVGPTSTSESGHPLAPSERLGWKVKAEALHNLNRYTPLENFELTGRVRATYVRGQCAFERRPEGTEGWSEEKLAELVTRDCMIGVTLPKTPAAG